MKKFTVSFLTILVFITVSLCQCLCAYAEESEISEYRSASINMSDYCDFSNSGLLKSDLTLASNNNDDSFLYYNQLDSNNKAAYDAIKSWIEPTTDTITIVLPDPLSISASSSDMSKWSDETTEEFWTMVVSAIKNGELAFSLDFPEVFWYDPKTIGISTVYTTSYNFWKRAYTITVKKINLSVEVKAIYSDIENAANLENYLKQQIDDFKIEGTDYYTKIKYMHDYIANTVSYNLNAEYIDTALGTFLEPYQIVCEGYSETIKLLCDREGIPCISVIGNVDISTNFAHMWNYIKMDDGKWYALDATWDDLDDTDNPVKYQYFLVGSDSFFKTHTPDTLYIAQDFVYPELSESDYVYSSEEPEVTTAVTTAVTTTTNTAASTTQTTTSAVKPATTSASVTTTRITTTITTTTAVVTTSAITTVPVILKGDFNQDNKVNLSDLVLLKQKLLKIVSVTADDFTYELNDDNILNIWDYILLLRKITG